MSLRYKTLHLSSVTGSTRGNLSFVGSVTGAILMFLLLASGIATAAPFPQDKLPQRIVLGCGAGTGDCCAGAGAASVQVNSGVLSRAEHKTQKPKPRTARSRAAAERTAEWNNWIRLRAPLP